MASSTPILLLLLITISITQIHARDREFFSKVTNTITPTETLVNKPETEEQPDFIPQNQNGHGLYGKENEQETISGVQRRTPATYAAERVYYNNDRNRAETETEQLNNGEKYPYSTDDQNDDALLDFDQNDDALGSRYNSNGVGTEHYNGEKYNSNSNRYQNDDTFYNNNKNGVETEHYNTLSDNLGETETYYSKSNTDDNNNEEFGTQLRGTDNGFTNELNTRYNNYRTGSTGSNVVRQGMSDTRFMENGRYYYDLNNEEKMQNTYYNYNNYNPKSNYNSEYRSNDVDRVNGQYYDDNKSNRFYDNSGGEKYEFNTMEEYERSRQNQYNP